MNLEPLFLLFPFWFRSFSSLLLILLLLLLLLLNLLASRDWDALYSACRICLHASPGALFLGLPRALVNELMNCVPLQALRRSSMPPIVREVMHCSYAATPVTCPIPCPVSASATRKEKSCLWKK